MKRAIVAAIVALAGAALAQSVGTTSSQTSAPDAGYVQNAQNAPSAGDAGPTNNANPAAQSGQQQSEIYTFDPPPVGQYSFSVSTPNGATSR